MRRLTLARLALLWAVALAPSFADTAAWAQGGPIRIIVGTAPGGAIEPYARVIAEHMARTLGQPIIIENKPGASGNIAAQYIVDQPADGSIIWLGTPAFAEIAPNTFPNARWSIDQFHPIIRGVEAPLVFVTAPSVPAGNLAEFIAWAKANRGKLSYSSYQAGTPSHFLGFQMNEKWDLDLTHVPYRGSGLQVTGLLGGHSRFGFAQLNSSLVGNRFSDKDMRKPKNLERIPIPIGMRSSAARAFTKTRCRYSRPARLLGAFLLDRAAGAA